MSGEADRRRAYSEGAEDLATDVLGVEKDRLHVGASGVETRGEPGGSAADDDEVEIGQLRGPF